VVGIDLDRDADKLALALEQCDPVAEVLRGHGASLRLVAERVGDRVVEGHAPPGLEAAFEVVPATRERRAER
jgi:hypothetical protein